MLTQDLIGDSQALLDSHEPKSGASRRTAIKAALGVGYAAAAAPIMAQTAIKTSSEGLRTGEVSFEVAGFKVPAYFAAPAGKTDLPVVLVVHEIFGVHEYIARTLGTAAIARINAPTFDINAIGGSHANAQTSFMNQVGN